MFTKHTILIIAAYALMGIFTACCNNSKSTVPYSPVRLDLQITAKYSHFIPENGFQTMTFSEGEKTGDYVGNSGLVIWINTMHEYRAADLMCPHCLQKDKPVVVDGMYATCPLCEEAFDLSQYAFPTKGKTNQPLKAYNTYIAYEGLNKVLRVRN